MFNNLFCKSNKRQEPYGKAINFAIDKFIECYDEWVDSSEEGFENADDIIYDQIFEHTHSLQLTNQIFVFIPVALTRIWFEQQPIKLSNSYSKVYVNSESKQIRLDSLEVYRQIVVVLRSRIVRLSNEDAFKILIHSSEFKIIDHALENGIKLEDVSIGPISTGV